MKLRALVGPYAGQVRDYAPLAARGALQTGMAQRIDDEPPAVRVVSEPVVKQIEPVAVKRSGWKTTQSGKGR